jgi:hypothetical protein
MGGEHDQNTLYIHNFNRLPNTKQKNSEDMEYYAWIFNCSQNLKKTQNDTEGVYVSSGCHDKKPIDWGLKQQKFIFSQFRRPKVQD